MRSMYYAPPLSQSPLAVLSSAAAGMLAACSFELGAVANELRLLPAGRFTPTDGRNIPSGSWHINAELAGKIIAQVDALKRKLVIDYEHQTLLSEKNGQPAPASGWFKKLEWREGQGLYATDVKWTANARRLIEAEEYKYISPVFTFNPTTGDVIRLRHVALTNDPGLDCLGEVFAEAAAKFNADHHQEINTMTPLLKAVLAALKLPDTTTEDDAVAGIAALKAKADNADALTTEVATLKTQIAAKPDPAKYVSIETMTALQGEVATLRAQHVDREIDEAVAAALAEGKLLASQEAWARDLGKSNIAALKTYIATAPQIAALRSTQTGGKGPGAEQGRDSLSIANAALKYQREQAAAGNNITTAQAVDHVSKGA